MLLPVCRYCSRALVIPFENPTVGPQSDADIQSFKHLLEVLHAASAAVGWAISMGKTILEGGHLQGDCQTRVRSRLQGVDPRLCTGYCTLLFCAEKVNII